MPHIEHLTEEEQKALKRLAHMTDEDINAHYRLLKDEPIIIAFFSKRKAYALVLGSIKKTTLWVAGLFGAIVVGFDNIKAFLTHIVQLLLM